MFPGSVCETQSPKKYREWPNIRFWIWCLAEHNTEQLLLDHFYQTLAQSHSTLKNVQTRYSAYTWYPHTFLYFSPQKSKSSFEKFKYWSYFFNFMKAYLNSRDDKDKNVYGYHGCAEYFVWIFFKLTVLGNQKNEMFWPNMSGYVRPNFDVLIRSFLRQMINTLKCTKILVF